MNELQTDPVSTVDQWLDSASGITPQWRARRHLRETLLASPDLQTTLSKHTDRHIEKYVRQLFDHPYWSFEPRPNNFSVGDEQELYYESQALTTVCLGGNGSGKSYVAAQRLLKFCCEDQPPPMRDTPFFVIAVTLEEAQRTCWTQHLYKLLPEEWVDWPRIVYNSRKLNWPRVVPLNPWAGKPEANWTLYFCGYSQDRAAFQSVAAGGAWFTEQCDYDIYEEVLFRMRRYMFPGSIWMEFTPIDPSKAVEIKQKYEDWCAGKIEQTQWQFARLNTEEAAKQGHVKQEIVDQAKASMSADILATRLYGVFAGYEGSIYKDFNSRVHLIPNDYYKDFEFNPDLIHKRGVDWGQGPANAFVVLWLQKDTMGRWIVYDEYYTTESNTWEDRFREIHRKDGWNLVPYINEGGSTQFRLEPLVPHPRWQYGAANFQQTYAPHDQPGLFREAAKYMLPMVHARMDYEVGIDAVSRCLKFDQTSLELRMTPNLLIDRKQCPNLSWEVPALQWQEMPGYKVNPRAVKRYQKKINDHSCTIATMPVLTSSGWKRIVDIRSGDLVASHDGWSKVLTGGTLTRKCADLVELSLSNGRTIVCTPDHRLMNRDGRWLRADELENQILLTWDEVLHGLEMSSKWWSATELSGVDTLNHHCKPVGTSVSGMERSQTSYCYIGGSTSTMWPTYQMGLSCITKMETCRITGRATWRPQQTASICMDTSMCTPYYGDQERNGGATIQTDFEKSLRTRATSTGAIQQWLRSPVPSAGQYLQASMCGPIETGIALQNASELVAIPCQCNVNTANSRSAPIPHALESSVAENALRVTALTRVGRDTVYCIAVDSGSMVWEGGVIAKNCDALRYAIYTDWIETATSGTTGLWREMKPRPQVRHARERRR
jgi:hypothetical protein